AGHERNDLIDIGDATQVGRDKALARDGKHYLDDRRVRHLVRADLALDHVEAGGLVIEGGGLGHGAPTSRGEIAARSLYRSVGAKTIARHSRPQQRLDPAARRSLYDTPGVEPE